jgi:Zn-dependent peptidase ImmA (M78 family)
MSNYSSSLEQARRRAMHAAMREHVSLHADLTKRIDIFGILDQKRLWTLFDPSLDSLYGAYLYDNNHGIVINAKHPPNLQRFTAAHEYGHYVMKHQTKWDKEEQILPSGRVPDLEEVEAQTFAAHFLMPLQLVNATLHFMGLPPKPDSMTAKDAYRLSLELGVSYVAVVNHLVTLKKLSPQVAGKLRQWQPKMIKKEIGQGIAPQDSWADVWTFNKRDTGREVFVYVNDELHIRLPEEPFEEHPWIVSPAIADFLTPLEIISQAELSESDQPSNIRDIVFRAQSPGNTLLRLEKYDTQPDLFELRINILPRQVQGLRESQKNWLLDS